MKSFSIFLFIISSTLGFAQNGFNVTPVYRKAITQSEAKNAVAITDINPDFPSSWISEYVSVELTANCNGKATKANGSSIMFSTEQIALLRKTDIGSNISFNISYYADTDEIKNRELKRIAFDYGVAPESIASYEGGNDKLDRYLVNKGLNEISATLDTQQKSYQVNFTVDKNGTVINAYMNDSTGLLDVDEALIKAVRDMGKWQPALNSNGGSIAQDFVLNIGMIGC